MSDSLSETSDLQEIVVKVLLSALLGGAVGAERERTGKWAGLRTHMLIAVGSALLTDVSVAIGTEYGRGGARGPLRVPRSGRRSGRCGSATTGARRTTAAWWPACGRKAGPAWEAMDE